MQVHKHACNRLLAGSAAAMCIALSVGLMADPASAAPVKTEGNTQMESPEAAVPFAQPEQPVQSAPAAAPTATPAQQAPEAAVPITSPAPISPVTEALPAGQQAAPVQPQSTTGTAGTVPPAGGVTSSSNTTAGNVPVGIAPAGTSLPPIRLKDVMAPINKELPQTLDLNTLYLSRPIEMSSFAALRHESDIDQEITLHDAINYVLDQGMQIKISRESMNYQHWLTLGGAAGFLPSFSTQYNVTYANVYNDKTTSLAKTFQAGVSFPVFQGGAVLYSLLGQRYRERAWREAYKATVSDVFLDVYQKYNNLILQRILLQTWAKAVEADEQQLKSAHAALEHGTGTRYNVMQVEALLSSDKQSFLQQSVTMRQAGLVLNLALNYPLSINLVPVEKTINEAVLFDKNVPLKSLLHDAFRFSSGMRQYEYFRLAAARNIQAQSASLYPSVAFFILFQRNDASVSPAANGAALGGAATSAIDNFLDTSFAGRVSNNALGQQYSFSPTAGSTSSQGANTGPSAMPASSGGTPIAQVQSGSLVSSGAVAPSIFGGGTGSGSGPNANGSFQAPAGIFPGHFREWQMGFSMSWSLPNLGQTTTATILASKTLARQALMQCNQELSILAQQVRGDYLNVLAARESIDQAADTTVSTHEALRDAKIRLENGINTQLDVIRAQHDYISALTTQGQAIVASNIAQAQLLHDMGMISATTLTQGYKAGSFIPDKPTAQKVKAKP